MSQLLLPRVLPHTHPDTRYQLRQLRNEAPPRVPAGPVQDHIAALYELGLPTTEIAAAAGVSGAFVSAHLRRTRDIMFKEYADAILAVTWMPHPAQRMILGVGVRRRIQGLAADGWSMARQARLLGMSRRGIQSLTLRPLVHSRWREPVIALYEEHGGRRGPDKQARSMAARLGYPASWAWDDDTIDDPNVQPVAWQRTGDPSDTPIDEVLFLMSEIGGSHSNAEVAVKLKVELDSVTTALRRHHQRLAKVLERKISDDQVAEMRRRAAAGENTAALAAEYGISRPNASNIIAGRARPVVLAETG